MLSFRCENGLLLKVSKDNCIYFYMKSSEFAVENLKKFCSDLIISNWVKIFLQIFKTYFDLFISNGINYFSLFFIRKLPRTDIKCLNYNFLL